MNKRLGILWVTVLAAAAGCMTGNCALVSLTRGSLDFLRQEKQVNLEYVYDGMSVRDIDKKEDREEDFIAKTVAGHNQKQAGRGEKWRQGWTEDRAGSYQPKFCELLNKSVSAKRRDLEFGAFKDAKYTLILKTTYTELGWKLSAIIKHPFFISGQALLVETQNRSNVAAVVTITKAPGNDPQTDFVTRQGLAEAYAKAGKELGSFICKTLK
jgi:hypothetical protein